MSSPVLVVERSDAVVTITLNRPEAMNALSLDLRLALGKAFRDIQADPTVRVAILTGAGRAFCGGMDLKELASGEAHSARTMLFWVSTIISETSDHIHATRDASAKEALDNLLECMSGVAIAQPGHAPFTFESTKKAIGR